MTASGAPSQLSVKDLTDWLALYPYSLQSISNVRDLRSADKGDLVVPSFRRERSGRRGFSVAGPCCWNSLPPTIRCLADQPETFKKALKTYFMQQYWLSASAVS